jgi:acyl carrier protein
MVTALVSPSSTLEELGGRVKREEISNSAATVREAVTAIWQEVLELEDVAPGATFFESNGHSIAAVRITARVREQLGVEIDVVELFKDPDLDTFIQLVAEQVGGRGQVSTEAER